MAIYHCQCKVISCSAGRTATWAAAYRSSTNIYSEMYNCTHNYSDKGSADWVQIVVPNGTPLPDRAGLWNMAEAADHRINSCQAREWEIALPAELPASAWRELTREFAEWLCNEYGVAADIAIHSPVKEGDQRNWHAHIMTTTRVYQADGRLGVKTRILDDMKTRSGEVKKIRKSWETICNNALERAGFSERISAGRLPEGEISTIHVGTIATAISRRTGRKSENELFNERIKECRELQAKLDMAKRLAGNPEGAE